jgi:WD40 repeat protein
MPCAVALAVLALIGLGGPASAAGPEFRPPRTDSFGDPLPKGAVARLGTLRWKGSEGMKAFAFSPDGKFLAAACGDDKLRVWSYPDGRLVRSYTFNNAQQATSLAFTTDQKQIAAGGQNIGVRILDLKTGRFAGSAETNWSAVVAPNGRWAVAGRGDGQVYHTVVIDLDRPGQVRELAALPTRGRLGVHGLAISPDGRWAALAANDVADDGQSVCRAQLFDVATGRTWQSPPFGNGGQYHLLFSPDGKSLVVAGEQTLFRWEIRPPARDKGAPELRLACLYARTQFESVQTESLAMTPDGRHLVVGRADGRIAVWDVVTGKLLSFWSVATVSPVSGLAVAPDGRTIAAASEQESAVRLFDLVTGRDLLPRTGHRGAITDVAFHPSGKSLATCSTEDGTVRTWDLTPRRAAGEDRISGREFAVLQEPANAFSNLAFGDGGRLLFAGGTSSHIAVWDASKRERPRLLAADGQQPQVIAAAPDGAVVAVGVGQQQLGVRLYDGRTGETLKNSPEVDESVNSLAFIGDGKVLAVGTASGRLLFFDAATGKPRRTPGSSGQGAAARYFLTTIEGESCALIWDCCTGRLARRIEDVAGPGCLSPDGRYLASTRDGGVALIEVASGRPVLVLRPNTESVPTAAGFSPDGSLLAVGYADGTALLWDALPTRGKPLPADELPKAWDELAADAPKAFAAAGRLAADPPGTVKLLKVRLKAEATTDPRALAQLIADLGHPRYAVREAATRRLEALAGRSDAELETALPRADAETARRIERALRAAQLPSEPGEGLQAHRAVAVLERVGTPEARQLLREVARGAGPAAREARDALERLRGR